MNERTRRLLSWAAISGFLGVALGAFAAHGLKPVLEPNMFAIFDKGVRYQMHHTLALFGAGLLHAMYPYPAFFMAARLFLVGILLFSGSLYGLALSGYSSLGFITPFGGSAFLLGWLGLFWGIYKMPGQ